MDHAKKIRATFVGVECKHGEGGVIELCVVCLGEQLYNLEMERDGLKKDVRRLREEVPKHRAVAESLAEMLEWALEEYAHTDSDGVYHCIQCGATWKEWKDEHHAGKCQTIRHTLAKYKGQK